jgi:hypothetical protein
MMRGLGMEVSAVGVARAYADFLDVLVIDQQDAALAALGALDQPADRRQLALAFQEAPSSHRSRLAQRSTKITGRQ